MSLLTGCKNKLMHKQVCLLLTSQWLSPFIFGLNTLSFSTENKIHTYNIIVILTTVRNSTRLPVALLVEYSSPNTWEHQFNCMYSLKMPSVFWSCCILGGNEIAVQDKTDSLQGWQTKSNWHYVEPTPCPCAFSNNAENYSTLSSAKRLLTSAHQSKKILLLTRNNFPVVMALYW